MTASRVAPPSRAPERTGNEHPATSIASVLGVDPSAISAYAVVALADIADSERQFLVATEGDDETVVFMLARVIQSIRPGISVMIGDDR